MLRAIHYDEDIAIAKALISHLQANISGASSYLLGGEGESPSSSTTNLDVPEGAAAAGGAVSTRDSAVDQKPGEFVRKKDTEEVLVPARWTTVRRRSKREKRKSTVSLSLPPSLSLSLSLSVCLSVSLSFSLLLRALLCNKLFIVVYMHNIFFSGPQAS